jgi:hypothetical protein
MSTRSCAFSSLLLLFAPPPAPAAAAPPPPVNNILQAAPAPDFKTLAENPFHIIPKKNKLTRVVLQTILF